MSNGRQTTVDGGVIASGSGSRLSAVHSSKALVRVAGRPLIDHVLEQFVHAGIAHAAISTRPDDDELRRHLDEHWRDRFELMTVLRVAASEGSGGATRAVTEAIGSRAHLLSTVDLVAPCDLARRLVDEAERDQRETTCVVVTAPLQHDTLPAWVSVGPWGTVAAFGKDSPASPLVYGNLRWISARGASLLRTLDAYRASNRDSHIVQALARARPGRIRAMTVDIAFDVDDAVDVQMAQAWLEANVLDLTAAPRSYAGSSS